jgi:hypothetical protein
MLDKLVQLPVIGHGVRFGELVNALLDFSKEESIKINNTATEFEPLIASPRKKYGLIVLGNDCTKSRIRCIQNTSNLVYDALLAADYKDEDIYFVGDKSLYGCPNNKIMPPSKRCLDNTLEFLSDKITSQDIFFMYVLAHGGRTNLSNNTQSCIELSSKNIVNEDELEEILSQIKPNYSITYFNSCYSGGFAKRLGKDRNIAISTSKPNKITSGYVGPKIEEEQGIYATNFTLNFFSAIKKQMPDDTTVNINNNSLEGIFDYAAKKANNDDDYLGYFLSALPKNTPHLVYDKINPADIRI